ncbi:MAG: response regulator, partial [Deltaproteobacteria bacterium]|nr:response regulator [Deltaproteobacteria bacterium]
LMNVIGSPVHISKTIMNLVSNAAEAMTDGGRLIISTGNLILNRPISGFEEIEPGEYVTISVEDMGMGISPEDMKKIFEPFYTKKVMGRSGTGLGMSVVWWTIKDHQGYVDIQSAEGKGTLVTIYLPATRQQTLPKDVPLPMDDYFGQGESVLVVDDIKEQRELARTIFYELGYMVETVSSGEKAIAYLEEKKTDIVFLDMIMDPGMDGLDTLKQIIATNPQQKAIVTSGFSETDRIIEAENLGAVKFLKKPYQLEQLARLVKQLLRSE